MTRHVALQTSDPIEACGELGKLICPHQLRSTNRFSNIDVKYCEYNLGSIHLGYLKYGARVFIDIDELATSYIFKIPLYGQSSTRSGGNEFTTTDVYTGAVLSPGQTTNMCFNEDYEEILVSVNRVLLESQLYNLTGVLLPASIKFDPKFSLHHGVGQVIRELVLFLVEQADQLQTEIVPSVISRQYEEIFTRMVLTGLRHSSTDILTKTVHAVRPYLIRRVAEYIEENYNRPISMSELSSYAGISVRSLQSGFRNALNVTVSDYIKELRLSKLREKLLGSTVDDSVTNLIMLSGFSHLGRCAIEYKKKFGESPSETLYACRRAPYKANWRE